MSKMKPRTLSGFMELLPAQQVLFDRMKQILASTYQLYGFTPLDTPLIEASEVLLAKGGGETEKQIYRVQLVLEELLVNIMLPQMKGERIAIDVTVEYSMKDSVLSVFAAADQEFSLEGQGGDDLSLSMLKAVSTDIVREANGVRLFL